MSASEVVCGTCGATFEHAGGRGRPPVHCPACRKPRGQDPNRPATVARSKAKRDRVEAAAGRAEVSAPLDAAMRMAFALEAHPDPVKAAQFAGLTLDPAEARALEKRARELYPDGLGNAALSGMAKATIGAMLHHIWSNVAHLKVDFTAGGAKALGQLVGQLVGADDAPASAEFHFTLTAASGEPLSVVRDPDKVMRPKLDDAKGAKR